MAKYQFRGLEEYARYLQKIQKNTPKILGRGVYEMAGVVADQVKRNIEALTSVDDLYNIKAYKEGTKSKLSQRQKQGLIDGFGISTMENDGGYLNVKLGFGGYNDVVTKRYPKGQPNVLIARSAESGTSYMDKTPFVRPAVRATEKKAIEKCKITIDKEIQKIDS